MREKSSKPRGAGRPISLPPTREGGGPLRPVVLAWTAAILDGEGHMALMDSTVRVSVEMVCRPLVLRLHTLHGGSMHKRPIRGSGTRPTHRWTLNGAAAVALLREVRPWLIEKADQADVLTSLTFNRVGQGGLTQVQIAARQAARTKLTQLRHRSWTE